MRSRLFPNGAPWGGKQVLLGVVVGIVLFAGTSIAVAIFVAVTGHHALIADVGDTFVIADRIVEYTDERLRAAALGLPLPDPPALKADIVTIRVAFVLTPVYQVLSVGLVLLITRRSPRELWRDLGFDHFDFQTVWFGAGVMVATYLGVALYAIVMNAIGPDILVPKSTVPSSVTRDTAALALAGVAAVLFAPVSEELFYRGMIFGGLLRWGFWPAAAISAFLFSGTHLDLGSLLPFFGVGLVLAWLAWRRGSLWDSIMFHLMFNSTSFILLVLTER